MVSPPDICRRCGATDTCRARYTTGGGWRVAYYVCENCGRKHDPFRDERVGADAR
jgi:transposase